MILFTIYTDLKGYLILFKFRSLAKLDVILLYLSVCHYYNNIHMSIPVAIWCEYALKVIYKMCEFWEICDYKFSYGKHVN